MGTIGIRSAHCKCCRPGPQLSGGVQNSTSTVAWTVSGVHTLRQPQSSHTWTHADPATLSCAPMSAAPRQPSQMSSRTQTPGSDHGTETAPGAAHCALRGGHRLVRTGQAGGGSSGGASHKRNRRHWPICRPRPTAQYQPALVCCAGRGLSGGICRCGTVEAEVRNCN